MVESSRSLHESVYFVYITRCQLGAVAGILEIVSLLFAPFLYRHSRTDPCLQVSRTTRIICVDRRQDLYHQIERVFSKDDHVVCLESSVARVLERFEREPFDVLIFSSVAAKGTEIDGVELLDVISAKSPATQILLLVKPSEIKMAMSALRAGTYQYSKLPVSDEELGLLIEAAIQQRAAHGPVTGW